MSWLARSIANTLGGGGGSSDDEDSSDEASNPMTDGRSHVEDGENQQPPVEPGTPTRGVKEDISELTQTLTRQFWGVASFLAPPPTQAHPDSSSPSPSDHGSPSGASDAAESPKFARIRSDFAEIGGKVRSGISMLSSHKAVSEISKIASTLFAPDEEEEEEEEEGKYEDRAAVGDVVGITDDVLDFVRNVLTHSETWLDFPLLRDEDDSVEFHMSDAQQEHALAVQRIAPQLGALRIELCPSRMSEGCFWKIYFVLLHPRLSKNDAEFLSTPQIMQARAMLLQGLPNRKRSNSEKDLSPKEAVVTLKPSGEIATSPANIFDDATTLYKAQTMEEPTNTVPLTEAKTDKHPIHITEEKVIDKSVIVEEPSIQANHKTSSGDISKTIIQKDEEGDEWLQEETGEVGGMGGSISLENEEDVSFSDLEDEDDDEGIRTTSEPKIPANGSLIKEESDWVQLKKNSDGAVRSGNSSSSQTREPNDWLDVDIDVV